MSEKQYRLNKWGTRLLRNNRPLFDWTNEADYIVDLLNCLNDENEQLKRSVQYWYDEHKRIVNNYVDKIKEVEKENEQLKKENYKLHKRLRDFEQFEEHIKERTSKTFVKECMYFDSVLGVCDIDGRVDCPCENYEELVRWIE